MACTWSTQRLACILSHSQLLLKSRTFLSRLVFSTDLFLYSTGGCQIIRLYNLPSIDLITVLVAILMGRQTRREITVFV